LLVLVEEFHHGMRIVPVSVERGPDKAGFADIVIVKHQGEHRGVIGAEGSLPSLVGEIPGEQGAGIGFVPGIGHGANLGHELQGCGRLFRSRHRSRAIHHKFDVAAVP